MKRIQSWVSGPIALALGVVLLTVAPESAAGGYVVSSGEGEAPRYAVLPDGGGAYAITVDDDGNVSYVSVPQVPGAYAVGVGNGGGVSWWTDEDTPYLGVNLEEEIEHPEGGARVTEIVDDSPADRAGLREDDIIVRFDGHTIRGPAGLTKRLHEKEPGDTVTIRVLRDGKERSLEIELGSRADAWRPYVVAPRLPQPGRLFSCDDGDCASIGVFGRARLGVQLVETTRELREHLGGSASAGVLVSKVLSGTAAEEAGIQVGDLIVRVDGEEVSNTWSLRRQLAGQKGTFEIEVIRNGKTLQIEVRFPEPEDDWPTGPRA